MNFKERNTRFVEIANTSAKRTYIEALSEFSGNLLKSLRTNNFSEKVVKADIESVKLINNIKFRKTLVRELRTHMMRFKMGFCDRRPMLNIVQIAFNLYPRNGTDHDFVRLMAVLLSENFSASDYKEALNVFNTIFFDNDSRVSKEILKMDFKYL